MSDIIEELRKLNCSPKDCSRYLRSIGKGAIETVRLTRSIYGLSLKEAKEALVQADGFADLNSYQRSLVPLLARLFEDCAREGDIEAE